MRWIFYDVVDVYTVKPPKKKDEIPGWLIAALIGFGIVMLMTAIGSGAK